MADTRNLRVCEAAEDFAATVEQAGARLDSMAAPGLRAQLLKAASSVAANIVEGAGNGGDAQFLRGLRIAVGSANEVGSHLQRARRTGALDPLTVARCNAKRIVVCKMLSSLISAVEQRFATAEHQRRANQ